MTFGIHKVHPGPHPENIGVAQNILVNMNTTQDALCGT